MTMLTNLSTDPALQLSSRRLSNSGYDSPLDESSPTTRPREWKISSARRRSSIGKENVSPNKMPSTSQKLVQPKRPLGVKEEENVALSNNNVQKGAAGPNKRTSIRRKQLQKSKVQPKPLEPTVKVPATKQPFYVMPQGRRFSTPASVAYNTPTSKRECFTRGSSVVLSKVQQFDSEPVKVKRNWKVSEEYLESTVPYWHDATERDEMPSDEEKAAAKQADLFSRTRVSSILSNPVLLASLEDKIRKRFELRDMVKVRGVILRKFSDSSTRFDIRTEASLYDFLASGGKSSPPCLAQNIHDEYFTLENARPALKLARRQSAPPC